MCDGIFESAYFYKKGLPEYQYICVYYCGNSSVILYI